MANLDAIVKQLEEERDRLESAIRALRVDSAARQTVSASGKP